MESVKTLNLALVAGKGTQLPALQVFSRFASVAGCNITVRVHGFLGSVPDTMRQCGFAFNLYEADPSRAGYMAGLEEQLAGADLVVAAGAENLSTFQALRASLKSRIPFHVISFDQMPDPYQEFPNIRAIRHDVLGRAAVVWATGDRALEVLRFEGFDSGRARLFPMLPDASTVPLEAARGERFRGHTGIAKDAFVIFHHGNLDARGPAGEVVKALHAMRVAGVPDLARAVVLFCGDRDGSDPLKYMVSDWQLSPHVRFLHQDPSPFLVDLMNASQMAIGDTLAKSSESALFSATARLAGATPVISMAQSSDAWGPVDGCALVPEFTGFHLAKVIKAALESPTARQSVRDGFIAACARDQSPVVAGFDSAMATELRMDDPARANSPGEDVMPGLENLVSRLEFMSENAKGQDTLMVVEDILLRSPSPELSARTNLVKGSVLFTGGKFEEATEAYRAALMSMHVVPNHETAPASRALVSSCYRGLGNVAAAVQSHQEALDLYRRALALEPQDAMTCAGIGNVYRKLRLYEESLHWLAKSAISMPDDESALTRFSQAVLECPEKDLAARALSGVVQVVGEHPMLARAMGSLGVTGDHDLVS